MLQRFVQLCTSSILYLISGLAASLLPCSPAIANPAERVDTLAQELLRTAALPALSLAILENGEIAHRGAFGFADLEKQIPATPNTRFRAASVSKILTVSALARLAERGVLDLDADLADLDFESHGLDFSPRDSISPRLLAGHLAGIGHYRPEDQIDRSRFYASVADSLEVFRHSPRVGKPGERYHYTTHGFTLLAAAMEAASGQPFLQILQSEVFSPLGMSRTGPDLRSAPEPEMSTLYRVAARRAWPILQPENPSYKWAGGGLVSTPSDLVRLAQAHFEAADPATDEPPLWLRQTTVDELWTPQTSEDGETTGVGIGWRIGEDSQGRRIIHHAGSMGGARSVLVLYPDEKRAIAVMVNAQWSSSIERTAILLLDAWRFEVTGPGTQPRTQYRYSGSFQGQPVEGSLTVSSRQQGDLEVPERVKEYLRGDSIDHFGVFPLTPTRWAVITPRGLAEGRLSRSLEDALPEGNPVELSILLGTNASLQLDLAPPKALKAP